MNRKHFGAAFSWHIALFSWLIVVMVSSSCTSSKEQAATHRDTTSLSAGPSPTNDQLPPNSCRVHATIIAVDTSLKRDTPTDPCSKFFCAATVRIDSVLGYGSSFSRPVSAGDTVSVTFLYTLAASSLVFPDMRPGLPGLSSGSAFVADIGESGRGMGGAPVGYTVRLYSVRELRSH
jgi:hypothetical protein